MTANRLNYGICDEMPHEMRDRLLELRDDLLFIMRGMLRKLGDDAAIIGLDGYAIMEELTSDVERKVHTIMLSNLCSR